MEFSQKPMREINIRATANGGYLVNLGCTNFAYTDEEKLIADLGEYIRDPQGVEEQYNKHYKAYDECAPERPSRAGGGLTSQSLGEMEPVPQEETSTQSEATDPAEDIESSGY